MWTGATIVPGVSVSCFTALQFGAEPIERVWRLTRRLATHNRYFAHVGEVAYAGEIIFKKWLVANNTLSKLYAII